MQCTCNATQYWFSNTAPELGIASVVSRQAGLHQALWARVRVVQARCIVGHSQATCACAGHVQLQRAERHRQLPHVQSELQASHLCIHGLCMAVRWSQEPHQPGPDGAVASCSSDWQVGPAVSISEGCLMELLSASGIADMMTKSSHQSLLIGHLQQGHDWARAGLCLTNTSERKGMCLLHKCVHV